jgi:hypothetical protein
MSGTNIHIWQDMTANTHLVLATFAQRIQKNQSLIPVSSIVNGESNALMHILGSAWFGDKEVIHSGPYTLSQVRIGKTQQRYLLVLQQFPTFLQLPHKENSPS